MNHPFPSINISNLRVPVVILLVGWFFACDLSNWELPQVNFPLVTTAPEVEMGDQPTEIRVTGAISGLLDNATVEAHGHLWSSGNEVPVLEGEVSRSRFNRLGNDNFSTVITDLSPGRPIAFRAYAIFDEKVYYGEVVQFTPGELNFQVSTDSIVQISRSESLSEVIVQSTFTNLPSLLTINELGVVWATHPEPSIETDDLTLDGLNILNDEPSISFQSKLVNLPANRYYVRAYVTVGERTYYGNTRCFSLGDYWVKLNNFPASYRPLGFNFSVNGQGHFGNGGSLEDLGTGPVIEGENYFRDHWTFNPPSEQWSTLADPPDDRLHFRSFVVDGKVYLGFGHNNNPFEDHFFNDLWEYDQETDQWIERASFPPGVRGELTAFAADGFIFAGLGRDEDPDGLRYQDFWQYNPASDQWIQKNDFPGGPRAGGESFSMGNKGFLLDGSAFWEYLPQSDEWRQKSIPDELPEFSQFVFALREKAYFLFFDFSTEQKRFMWEYDPNNDKWTERTPPEPANPFGLGALSIHFGIDHIGYAGLDGGSTDFWAYFPLIICE